MGSSLRSLFKVTIIETNIDIPWVITCSQEAKSIKNKYFRDLQTSEG